MVICYILLLLLLKVQKSGIHQLRLVVYPIIYKALYIPCGYLGISSINSMLVFREGSFFWNQPHFLKVGFTRPAKLPGPCDCPAKLVSDLKPY